MKATQEELRAKAKELSNQFSCTCDLDNWEPEKDTGHTFVCRIHSEVRAWQTWFCK